MSMGNGTTVIKIGKKGMRTFEFEGGKPFEIDVVGFYNQCCDMQKEFLEDKRNDKGTYNFKDYTGWVRMLVATIKSISGQEVSATEALEFWKYVDEIQEELQGFFVKRRAETSSSVPSSADSTSSDSTAGARSFSGPPSSESPPGKFSIVQEVMQES